TSSRVQLPVLANILFTASKNKLFLSSTNLESSIKIAVGAKVEKEGEITVPGKTVAEIVQNLDAGRITLSAQKESLEIGSDNFASTISGMNASDFPNIPGSVVKSSVLSGDNFKTSLAKVLFAVSSDETRAALTGVLLVAGENSIKLVATDGFRLSQSSLKIDVKEIKKHIIIPKNCLIELEKLLVGESEFKMSVSESDKQIVFEVGNAVLSSRLIEGDYPDFERIIPKSLKVDVDVDRLEFLKAVKLGGVFARDVANVLKLEIEDGFVNVLADSTKSGSQKTKVDARVGGLDTKNMVMAFNYKFLEDFLNSVDDENIKMSFTDPNSPGVFANPKDKDYLHIIMPVKL
ncbi:DNA polymerase III subunit beta, partial [Candidatus Woesebacteria bacterium GWA1_41_8]